MPPKDVERMANSVDPDQTVWSESTLFAQTDMSQYLEFLRYNLLLSTCIPNTKVLS